MSVLRIARIPYLNSVPFYRNLSLGRFDLLDLPPRQLGAAARQGGVDAGILSICDTFRSPDFEPLGGMGVAVDGPAQSVLLFSRRPPQELDGATIAVSSETSTSYPLLRVLFEQRLNVRPAAFERRATGPLAGEDAALLIGDAALAAAARGGLLPGAPEYRAAVVRLPRQTPGQPWSWAFDLSMAWNEWQGLPFVFARWMVRKGVDAVARDRLVAQLSSGLDTSLRELRAVAAAECWRAGLDGGSAYAYLMGFTYRFGARELQAVERFHAMLGDAAWWDPAGADEIESRYRA